MGNMLTEEALPFLNKFSLSHIRKNIENSMENMHYDVVLLRVNLTSVGLSGIQRDTLQPNINIHILLTFSAYLS